MRAITKGPEPASLTAHRKTPQCDYDNYPDKSALRHAQGGSRPTVESGRSGARCRKEAPI